MKVLILGMGAIGHSIAATINAEEIDVLVSKEMDMKEISSLDGQHSNKINHVYTYDTIETIDHDYLIVTLPYRFKILRMEQIKGLISPKTTIVYVPGNQGISCFMPEELNENPTVLFERVIHISRTSEYGSVVNIKGTKENMHIAYSENVDVEKFETLFPLVTNFISNHSLIDIALVSSNAVIHNPRTYRAFKHEKLFNKEFMFYETWTNEDSQLFIDLEKEVFAIIEAFEKLTNTEINYYDMFTHFNTDRNNPCADELTHNISKAPAFQGITFFAANEQELAMNRYIVDDMIISLQFYMSLAKHLNVDTPTMDKMHEFGKSLVNKVEEDFIDQITYHINFGQLGL